MQEDVRPLQKVLFNLQYCTYVLSALFPNITDVHTILTSEKNQFHCRLFLFKLLN